MSAVRGVLRHRQVDVGIRLTLRQRKPHIVDHAYDFDPVRNAVRNCLVNPKVPPDSGCAGPQSGGQIAVDHGHVRRRFRVPIVKPATLPKL